MRYQALIVAEIDCEPDGSDFQDKLDAFRTCVSHMDPEHQVTLFRPLASTVTDLCQGFTPEGFPAAAPMTGDTDFEMDD